MGRPTSNPAKKAEETAASAAPPTKGFWASLGERITGRRDPKTTKGVLVGILLEYFGHYFRPAPTTLIDDILLMKNDEAQKKILACLEKAWKDFSFPELVKAFMKATEGIESRDERQKILEKLAAMSDGEDFRPLIKIVSTGFLGRLLLEESDEAHAIRKKIIKPLDDLATPLGEVADRYASKTGADQTAFGQWIKKTRKGLGEKNAG